MHNPCKTQQIAKDFSCDMEYVSNIREISYKRKEIYISWILIIELYAFVQ